MHQLLLEGYHEEQAMFTFRIAQSHHLLFCLWTYIEFEIYVLMLLLELGSCSAVVADLIDNI